MRSIIIISLLFILTAASFTSDHNIIEDTKCGQCTYIVKGYHNDGNKLGIKPGDIICLDANMTYKSLRFSNIKGTSDKPVIIRNCGGVATVTQGIRFERCENFKFIGDGVDNEMYGIKVSTPKSFFITFEQFTTDFEAARIEVAGLSENGLGDTAGFAGMGIKTSPYQACDLFTDSTRQAWKMRNVSIHHNYIHDVGGEGLYIGHGFYKGRIEGKCKSKTYSHSIVGLRVYNNRIENTGFDGIQIKNADEDCEVYNNVIRNYGTRNHGAHNEGLMLADGVTGKAYNNLIHTGTGHGIMFQGMGNNDIYNNIVLNAGEDGFNGSGSKVGVYIPDGHFRIFNNTFYNSGKRGFVFFNNDGGDKFVINNLVINAEKLQSKGARLTMSNNIFIQDSTIYNLINGDDHPVILKRFEPAVDQGVDLRALIPALEYDFYHNKRPQGKGFDIGAIEYE